jgi:hypothetical protein
MWASPFDVLLFNLAEVLPEKSLYYTPREEAYRQLRETTGQDFGYDIARWEQWGREHQQCFPGVRHTA